MATHGMIDLETLDTRPSCTVLSLGAIKFNPLDSSEPHSELYFKVCEALRQVSKWSVGVDTIWGQGYGFDITILEDMYRMLGVPIPWQFWQIKDSRTLFTCCKTDPRKVLGQENLHNALADAYFQARGVQLAYNELGVLR